VFTLHRIADVVSAAAVLAIALVISGAHAGETAGDDFHPSAACAACLAAAPDDAANDPPAVISETAPIVAEITAAVRSPAIAERTVSPQPRGPPVS
jgi:hypothetical protein